jgi:hypothetical protein
MSQRASATSQSAASQPAAEPFVPFDPIPASAARPSSAAVNLKVVPKGEFTPAFTPIQTSDASHVHATPGNAGKPVVTLQREGDRVTGIRVECGCGQVIELACSY